MGDAVLRLSYWVVWAGRRCVCERGSVFVCVCSGYLQPRCANVVVRAVGSTALFQAGRRGDSLALSDLWVARTVCACFYLHRLIRASRLVSLRRSCDEATPGRIPVAFGKLSIPVVSNHNGKHLQVRGSGRGPGCTCDGLRLNYLLGKWERPNKLLSAVANRRINSKPLKRRSRKACLVTKSQRHQIISTKP